jgi:ankyrin repeat protein
LKQFLEGLQKDWITVAMYIGFDEEELQLSNDSENLSVNLDKFLDQWLMPDCGQKTTVILQKLLSVALPVGATSSRNIKQPLLQSSVGDSIELASVIELTPSSSNSLNQNNESLFSNTGNLDVIDRDRQPDRTTSIGLPNISSLLTPTSSRYSEVIESLPLISKSSRLMTKSLDVAMTTTHQANLPSFLKPVQSPSINVIKKHSSSTTNSMTFIRESKQVFPTTGDWPKPIQQTAPSNHQLLFSAPTPPTNTTWVYTVPKTFKPTSRASPEDSPHEDNVDPQEITLPSFSTNSYNKDNVTVLSSDNVHGNDIFASSTAANAVTLCSGNNLNDIDSAPVNISDKLIAILLEKTDEDLQEFLISLDKPIELLHQPVSQLYQEYGSLPLLIAARKGLIDKLNTLIANGANANQMDKLTGDTALHVAAEVGNLELIQLLIEQHNADVDARNNHMSTPLLTACFKVRPNCVTFLLNSRANINVANNEGCTPLVIAVVAGSVDIVKILLDRLDRVPPPDINHIRKCVNPNGKEYKVSPIADAAARGYLEVLKLLQEKGANLNSTGQHQIPPDESDGYTSPLCLACLNNKVQIVKYLIDQPGFRMDLRFVSFAGLITCFI